MARALVLILFAAVLAAAEGWETWWQRAERDLQLADRAAARAARAADPPPPGCGGLALAHHRLLLAWLGGDASAGGHLAAVRNASIPCIALLAPGTRLAAAPGLPADGGMGFHPAVAMGGPPELGELAGKVATLRGNEAAAAVSNVLYELRWRDMLWGLQPEEAKRRTGLASAPAPLPQLEVECMEEAMYALLQDDDYYRRNRLPQPSDRAFAARVGAACPPAWRPIAWWIARESPKASQPRAAAERALALTARIGAAARSHAGLLRLAMPGLQHWADGRRWERRFGLTNEVAAMVTVLRQHLDDPVAAASDMAAFQRAGAAWLAETAWADRPTYSDEFWIGLCNRRSALAPAVAAWERLAVRLSAWAAENAAAGRRLPAWSDAEAAAALERLAALDPELAAAREELSAADASRHCGEGLFAMLVQVRTALTTHRAVLEAQRAGQTRVLAALQRRDSALAAIATARSTIAAAEADLALVAGSPVASLPLSCGLGEPLATAPGRSDESAIDTPLLDALAEEPWRALAVRLVGLRRSAAAEIIPTWQQLRRRHALFASLAAAGHPDLDAIAADLARDGANASAAMLTGARRAPAIPPAVDSAVQAWLVAAARPAAGRQAVPAREPTREQHTERFMCQAADLGNDWGHLAALVIESRRDPLPVLARQEALTAIAAPDAELAALARESAVLLRGLGHYVAAAHLDLAAKPDPQARQRYLAAARAWIAAVPAEPRTP
jgi:hypothetical protein